MVEDVLIISSLGNIVCKIEYSSYSETLPLEDELCLYWINPERKVEIIPIKYLKKDVKKLMNYERMQQ